MSRGRAPEAEQQYRKALESVPDNARVWSALGSAYYLQEKYARGDHRVAAVVGPIPDRDGGGQSRGAAVLRRPVRRGGAPVRARECNSTTATTACGGTWRRPTTGRRTCVRAAAEAYRRAAELAERERAIDPADARVLADLAELLRDARAG